MPPLSPSRHPNNIACSLSIGLSASLFHNVSTRVRHNTKRVFKTEQEREIRETLQKHQCRPPFIPLGNVQSFNVNGSTLGSCSVANCFPVQRHAVHITFPDPEQKEHVDNRPLSSSIVPVPTQFPHGKYPVPSQ